MALHFRYDRAGPRGRRRVTDPRADTQDHPLSSQPDCAGRRGDTRHNHSYRCRLRGEGCPRSSQR